MLGAAKNLVPRACSLCCQKGKSRCGSGTELVYCPRHMVRFYQGMRFTLSRKSSAGIEVWAGLAISLAALALYIITLSPTVNFIDSGEFITVGVVGGVAHPPGYPLYTLLSILAAALPGGNANAAWRINLISAVSGAAAVGFFYTLVYEALAHHLMPKVLQANSKQANHEAVNRSRQPKSKAARPQQSSTSPQAATPVATTERGTRSFAIASAAGAALVLAGSQTFWNWSTQSKVYSLHFAFLAALFWLALRVRRAMRGAQPTGDFRRAGSWPAPARWLLLFAFALGLAFTNHYMSYLLLPGLGLIIFWPDSSSRHQPQGRHAATQQWRWVWRYAPALLVAAIAPLLLYLYLPIRAAQNPILNWGEPSTMQDFLRHVTAWQYRNFLGPQGSFGDYLGLSLGYAAEQVGPALGLVLLAFAAGGAVRLAKANLAILAGTALTLLATLVFVYNYQNAEIEAYSEPMYMMLLFWAGIGFGWFMQAVAAWVSKRRQPQQGTAQSAATHYPSPTVLALPIALAALTVLWNVGRAGHYNDYTGEEFVRNRLDNLPQNAILITDSWYIMSPTYYMQQVLGQRRDVAVIDKNLARYPFYLDYMDRQYAQALAPVKAEEQKYRQQESLWYANQPYDPNLPQYFTDFMRAIITKNMAAGRPVYFEWYANDQETAAISQGFQTHPDGLMLKVDAQPYVGPVPNPTLNFTGILTNRVPKDRVAHWVLDYYVVELQRMADYARSRNDTAAAARYSQLADQVSEALGLSAK